jgi:hypothetical protein
MITRAGGALAGPIPTVLRAVSLFTNQRRSQSLRQYAACCSVMGSLLTRIAWIYAGHVSPRDWKLPLEIETKSEASP